MTEQALIAHVTQAINPAFTDWVLFAHGTYVVFDDPVPDRRAAARQLLQEFGPVEPGGPGGDFNVMTLNRTEGWVVGGHGYGMYTYVHPAELSSPEPTDVEVGLYGRGKRGQDAQEQRIIFVNQE